MHRNRRRWLVRCAAALLAALAGCTEAEPALCPVSDATSAKRLVVATELHFVTASDGVSDGFDLDGRVSDASDELSCKRQDFVSPADVPGIDNQFSALWLLLRSVVDDAVEGLIQGVINDGTLLLMIQVDGIDDPENDGCVNVHMFQGAGRPDLSTMGRIAPGQTFDVEENSPYTVTRGRIEDGVLIAGPFEAIIPIAIFQVVADLRLHAGYLRATFVEDDPATPYDDEGTMKATIAGGVETEQIMEVAEMAASNDGTAQALLPALPLVLGSNVDLGYDELTGKCNQLSTVMTLEATPAFLYEDANDPTR